MPRPPFDQFVAFCRVGELDSKLRDGQPLVRIEVHLIVEVPKLVEKLDSLSSFIKVWLTFNYSLCIGRG